jgi:hypothetical protein
MRSSNKLGVAVFTLAIGMNGCATELDELSQEELDQARQEFLTTTDGLTTINGLTPLNGVRATSGLRTANRLSTSNGLGTINGIPTMNGLKTNNGLTTVNGMSVDCTQGTLGVTCTGEPDGLLSASTGLMSSDDGVRTANYVVRCALPYGQRVTVLDHTGALVILSGELGLAPEWATQQCSRDCEEKVSACLMALTSSGGIHSPIALTNQGVLGATPSASFPYQEGGFYGNLFMDPPLGFFCAGRDYVNPANTWSLPTENPLVQRVCGGYGPSEGLCPYRYTGACNGMVWSPGACGVSNTTFSTCKGTAPGTVCTKNWWGQTTCSTQNTTVQYTNPITSWRNSKP